MGNRLLSVAQDDSSVALRHLSVIIRKLFILELAKSVKCALSAHHAHYNLKTKKHICKKIKIKKRDSAI